MLEPLWLRKEIAEEIKRLCSLYKENLVMEFSNEFKDLITITEKLKIL